MTILPIMLAVSIAVPREGQALPFVEKCYVLGATEPGVTNVVVQGRNVPVYRTGAWAAYVDVSEGENRVVAVCEEPGGRSEFVRTFKVAARPKPCPPVASDGTPAPQEKVYGKLEYAADDARPHPLEKSPKELTVVLDPGHGGAKDLGCLSPHGWCEKTANLMLAEDVRTELVKLGYRVVLTRRNDRAIGLYDRPKAAYAVGGDVFVSIHHNAPVADKDAGSIRYSAVYSWNPLGDRLATAIAKRMDEAAEGEPKSNGVIRGNLAVTRNPEIPSCLVEADFITHPAGEEAAWDSVHRAKVAAAIARGIADWHEAR